MSRLAETRELLRVAAGVGFVAGVVGWVDLVDPAYMTSGSLAALTGILLAARSVGGAARGARFP